VDRGALGGGHSGAGVGAANTNSLSEDPINKIVEYLTGSGRLNALRLLKHRFWALNYKQWDTAVRRGIADLPNVSSRQLDDLDKGEALVKALALIQVSYLVVQLTARKVAQLPSTQLEMAALAFSASSMVTYVLYWNRPQGVKSVHVIKAKSLPDLNIFRDIAENGPGYLWTGYRTERNFNKELDLAPIPNDSSHPFRLEFDWLSKAVAYNNEIVPTVFGVGVGGTLFGGLHCLAWNFDFPTLGEALAWRICSVVTGVVPLLSLLLLVIWMQLDELVDALKDEFDPIWLRVFKFIIGAAILGLLLAPYVLARLFLIFEIFRSLFFLPPQAFIDTWSVSFPHWG
jgi:hypothetical protein